MNAPRIDDLELLHRLGADRSAELWLGRALSAAYCLVRIFADDEHGEVGFERATRFQQLAAGHPEFLPILRAGRSGGRAWCVLPLVDALDTVPSFSFAGYVPRTLQTELERRRSLPAVEAIDAAWTVARAVDHLRASGLVHGQIVPASVVFVDGTPKLADGPLVAVPEALAPPGESIPHSAVAANVGGSAASATDDPRDVALLLAELLLGLRPKDAAGWTLPPGRRNDRLTQAALRLTASVAQEPRRGSLEGGHLSLQLGRMLRRQTPAPHRWPWRRTLTAGLSSLVVLLAAALWHAHFSRTRSAVSGSMHAPGDAQAVSAPHFPITHALQMDPLVDPAAETRVHSAADSAFDLPDGFTVEAWLLPASLGASAGLVGKLGSADSQGTWEILCRYRMLEAYVGGLICRSPPMLQPMRWQHVAVTWDPLASAVAFYHDGVLRGVGRGPRRLGAGLPAGVWVGGTRLPDCFPGVIDEVRLWRRPRAPAEIFRCFARPLTAVELADSTLVAYWPFEEGLGPTARDVSGHGRDLVLFDPARPQRHDPTWFPRDDLAIDTLGIDAPVPVPRVLGPGFVVRELARLPRRGPRYGGMVAAPPAWSAFAPSVVVASSRLDSEMPWDLPDVIYRIDPRGQVSTLVELRERDASVNDIRFPPAARWGDYLYVCANGQDGYAGWDLGGAILRVDPGGHETVFVPNSSRIPEPCSLAFAAPGAGSFADFLYVANGSDPPYGAFSIAHDGGFAPWTHPLPVVAIEFGHGGALGGSLYCAMGREKATCRIDADGTSTIVAHPLPDQMVALRCSAQGALGEHLWGLHNGTVYRVDLGAEPAPFLTGLTAGGFDIAPDGSALYAVDALTARVWVVEAAVSEAASERDASRVTRSSSPGAGLGTAAPERR